MTLDIVPLILIVASSATCLGIVIRKLPQLSLLDVDNLPEVKEEKKKEAVLKDRVERKAQEARAVRRLQWQPIMEQLKDLQRRFRRYVGRIERMVLKEVSTVRDRLPGEKREALVEQARTLVNEGTFALEQHDLETAEKKFIAAIRISAKYVDAYLGLGDVYAEQGQVPEAKETYQFVLQLNHNDDRVLMKLAELAEAQGQIDEAVEYYQRAVLINDHVPTRFAKLAEMLMSLGEHTAALEAIRQASELEPVNPKYLDLLAEISILAGDRALAEEAYRALRNVNPENQKLDILRDKIERMG